MISEPSASVVAGLPGLMTGMPFWTRVTESPAPAPVSHASSTDPPACSAATAVAPAGGATATSVGNEAHADGGGRADSGVPP